MIFARRSIQRFINSLSETLPQEAVEELVRKLNRNDLGSLDFEWEVAVLFALTSVGRIDYESGHGGKKHPDVTFRLPGQETVSFIADITTVSDRGREEANPIPMLSSFLHEKAESLGLSGGFQYRVEGDQVGKRFGDRKVKLAMPNKKQLRAYLDKHVTPHLRKIKKAGLEVADIPINEPYRIAITYRKNASASWGSHPSYTTAYSLTKNPISTSLKEKAGQLSETGFEGCKGIFLCDGSCEIFRTRPNAGTSAYSKHEIIGDFLRQNTSIAFVAVIWVEQPHRGVFDPPQRLRLHFELFQNPAPRFPLNEEMGRLIHRIPDFLPVPATTALVALRGIAAKKYSVGKSLYGRSEVGIERGSTVVRISSRALLDLLAGQTIPSRFSEDHWPDPTRSAGGTNNPFVNAVNGSMMIEMVTVEHNTDEDDDWITFKLSWPDAATSPFRVG